MDADAAEPTTGSAAEAERLPELVHHRRWLWVGTTLEQAQRIFATSGMDFLPVADKGRRPLGLCSRVQVGQMLGSRFGFALHSETLVETAMAPKPLIVASTRPLPEVVALAMARRGAEFVEDVVVVGEEGTLIGVIRAETLAQVQSRMVERQLAELRTQRAQLQRQNVELFQTNHALRQSKGLYLGLFENHALGIALLGGNGRVQALNRRLTDLLRAGEQEDFSLAERIVERDRGEFRRMLEACEHGRAFAPVREFTFQVPKMGARLFRCSMGWIRETGQACVCLDDITEQRALESQAALHEKQSLLESLVGGIAHELNNKLAPVRGFAELLQNEGTAPMRTYSGLIIRSVDEASRIVKQLRELTVQPGPDSRAIDLRVAVSEALAMLQFRLQASRCAVRRELPAEPVWVKADAGQIKQVMMNLGANALDAMLGRPDPLLRVALKTEGGFARLLVTDNGVGIAADVQRRIFDPFYTTKGPDRGTGLGLSICLSIVRQGGGEITVASEPGAGATFEVKLPLAEAREMEVPGPERTSRRGRLKRPGGGLLQVLAVDDEEVIRHLLQEQLRRSFECRVELAGHGLDALAAVERTRFDLIVVDLLMPEMSGNEFYAELLHRHPEAAQRVVFVTGHAGGESVETDLAGWRRPVLRKPFTHEQLDAACREVLVAGSGAVLSLGWRPL